MVRILGVDPGTRMLGFGLIACHGRASFALGQYQTVDAGLIRADASVSALTRIGSIHLEFDRLLTRLKPDYLFIESAFFGRNPQSALRLGEARGCLIAAAARTAVPLTELSPTAVKKNITGNGHASKSQVAHCVRSLLNIHSVPDFPFDVSDALAIALCGALHLAMQ
ncbi:MAG: crossover junction endodeoxyribonuclease RuvC [Deltaproteobacteria bacterium]|nr:crossover junction endodeoxyribonuclease RuvC [Deltaproteobacteria bacterium]